MPNSRVSRVRWKAGLGAQGDAAPMGVAMLGAASEEGDEYDEVLAQWPEAHDGSVCGTGHN